MNKAIITTEKRFIDLYQSQSDAVFRYCFLRVSDREVALDIAQESFMKLWDSMIDEKQIDNHRAFLFTIARHLIIDWYRKKKATSLDRMVEESESEDIDSLLPMRDGVREKIEIDAEGRYLIDKIQLLEPLYQQVVYFHFIEGLGPKEMAKVFSQTPNVMSVRLKRGIEKLRVITGMNK